MTWLGELSKFIRELLPILSAFFLGTKVGESEREKLEAKKRALALEIERFRIQEKIRLTHLIKSDPDVIDGAIKSGSEMLKSTGAKSDE